LDVGCRWLLFCFFDVAWWIVTCEKIMILKKKI
jgi:hypothetical protein